ncbi:MAG TPA: hypothetical protein PKD83_11145, partial [Ignavibacteria bacterium]|nr:hypothetical protein [Ignavibacteria bacterium]
MKKITETLKAAVILKFIFILFIVSILSKEGFAYQDTITLGALSDNTLYEDAAGTISNGQGKYLHTGKGNTGLIRRALVRFMLVEFVPPCSKILSVTLKMHLSGGSTANKTIQLRRITDYWGEGNSDAPGLEENGTVSTSYDATWKHKFYNSDFWANAGGDYSAVSSGNAVVGAPGFYTWGSTPQMVSDVQNWTDDNSTANGWLLLGDESATSTAKRFHSSEADTFSFVPEITVIYKTANFSLYMESLIEGFWDGATMVD